MPDNVCLYGIKNCDSVKKSRKWLDENRIAYTFHDFRASGLNDDKLHEWLKALPQQKILNKRGTTWRNLDSDLQKMAEGPEAVDLLREHPTLIKRPVLEYQGQVYVGFTPELYTTLFQS